MSDFHDPDEIIDALRGPATAAELSGEADAIALMAQAHNPGGRTPMHFTSRRARIATLIAAGVIGFGGVAAAGAADQPIDVEKFSAAIGEPDGDTSGKEATEESSEDATTEEATDDGATDDGATERSHRAEPPTTEPPTSHRRRPRATDDGATETEPPRTSPARGPPRKAPKSRPPRRGRKKRRPPRRFSLNEAGCVTDAAGNELNHGKTVSAVAGA